MRIGYARTSTVEQRYGLEEQLDALQTDGCEKVYSEQLSGTKADDRPELQRCLDQLRDGDELVITKLDRLGRSVLDLCGIIDTLDERGVTLRALDGSVNTASAAGRLTIHLFAAVAEFENAIRRERQAVGIARAKAEGKYDKRADAKRARHRAQVVAMTADGKGSQSSANELGISRSTVMRIRREEKAA
ncbi:recombinase family protein [Parvularcula sp. ZS-1/3]|uniref:Recombinase family protein n=1 Tax=Parvularcula mediterranea TaxID=2732508 RepID=A0A7Y3RJB3_9PROT|nr:recombinase family protein [Parvularcula mediterranea]NNU15107.1 recombinase family protein [Parvularcula mediterranea]